MLTNLSAQFHGSTTANMNAQGQIPGLMELTMRCNQLDCRIELNETAVVTTCSHMFCLECAQAKSLFTTNRSARQCPACSIGLPAEDDCVATALNPREDYKTSILSGLSPAIIMECATRALAFYSYQASSAVSYQEYRTNSINRQANSKIHHLEDVIHQANGEIMKLRDALDTQQATIASLENKHLELSAAFKEKSRALSETQHKYQQLKAQAMATEMQYAASDDAEHSLRVSQTPGGRFSNTMRRTSAIPSQYSRVTSRDPMAVQDHQRARTRHSNVPMENGNALSPTRIPTLTNKEIAFGMTPSRQRPRTHIPQPIGEYSVQMPQSTTRVHASRGENFSPVLPTRHTNRSPGMGISGPSKRSTQDSVRVRGLNNSGSRGPSGYSF
ncbi:hypothetical protein BT63DRAFT_472249 [Microthyrium microscopicum]|uniref:RING-type domain-containing protein n=1 Tax=Microthyrium microscopicum TaxID=703497 RepID=A0A6A6U6G0_9PEZI|nr:hypothetical protein BT63DRAFT_472249 [Microthyrium microscopicum]